MPYALKAPVHHERVVKKSRFLATVQNVSDRLEAAAIVRSLRAQHPGATHVCWALMAGGQSAAVDDGEPSGTAGRPMLDVLRHQELDNVLATVVRYYGGVKLGAGGLLRAYTDAVAQALLQAQKIPLEPIITLKFTVPYALEGWARRCLEQGGATLLQYSRNQEVALTFCIAQTRVGQIVKALNDGGRGVLNWVTETAVHAP